MVEERLVERSVNVEMTGEGSVAKDMVYKKWEVDSLKVKLPKVLSFVKAWSR